MSPSTSYQGPSFLGIGAPRAGTTWLYTQLNLHPQVWIPGVKEMHYWDLQRPGARQHYPLHDGNWWALRAFFDGLNYRTIFFGVLNRRIPLGWGLRYVFARSSDRWYQSLFPQDKVCGDVTPGYMLLPPVVIEQIRQMNPSIKAIFLMRNPISRAWSNLCHSQRRKVDSLSVEQIEAQLMRPSSIDRGNYVQTIKNWRSVLGADRVFLGFYEDLNSQPRELLRQILEFLEVDARDARLPQQVEREVNASSTKRKLPEELVPKISAVYLDQLRELEQMVGGHVTKWREKAEEAVASGT